MLSFILFVTKAGTATAPTVIIAKSISTHSTLLFEIKTTLSFFNTLLTSDCENSKRFYSFPHNSFPAISFFK